MSARPSTSSRRSRPRSCVPLKLPSSMQQRGTVELTFLLPSQTPAENKAIVRRIDLCVLPLFLITQTLQYLDKTALNYGALPSLLFCARACNVADPTLLLAQPRSVHSAHHRPLFAQWRLCSSQAASFALNEPNERATEPAEPAVEHTRAPFLTFSSCPSQVFGMDKAMKLTGNQFSWAASIFYVGYLVAQYVAPPLVAARPSSSPPPPLGPLDGDALLRRLLPHLQN